MHFQCTEVLVLTGACATSAVGYVQLRPQLFAKYIPNVLPPSSLSDLDHYVQEVQQLQRDLLTHPDFIR